ncbi:MAG: hypothetical protein ACJAYU_004464 [Bradymonadia bacterium]|jgi:hypothetical protein
MVQPAVFVPSDVVEELAYAARYRPASYQAGVLLGQTDEDGGVRVAAYTDLSTLDGPFIFLKEMLSGWEPLQRRARQLAPELEIVGWVSFWPDHDASLGTVEAMVHRTFFNLPFQTTVCIDSASETLAAYGTDTDGELGAVPVLTADQRPLSAFSSPIDPVVHDAPTEEENP